jgi:mono/diheme cytochrome c family protein
VTRRAKLLGVVIALVVVGACSGGSSESSLPAQEEEVISRGSELFMANCAQCHGFDLRGTNAGPSLLSQVYEPGHHGDGAFLVAVQSGTPQHHWDFGPMPPVEGLTADDVEAIVAFVRQRQQEEGFEPYPP